MPLVGFKLWILAIEWLQIHTLNFTASRISLLAVTLYNFICSYEYSITPWPWTLPCPPPPPLHKDQAEYCQIYLAGIWYFCACVFVCARVPACVCVCVCMRVHVKKIHTHTHTHTLLGIVTRRTINYAILIHYYIISKSLQRRNATIP